MDPRALAVGIVHLGIGAFHRAHQAVYTEDAIAAEGGDWGICGVSQRSPAVVEQLAPQDGLYTLAQRDGAGERLRVIGAVRELRWAQADADAVRERIAAPATRLVTPDRDREGLSPRPGHQPPAPSTTPPSPPTSPTGARGRSSGSSPAAWRDGARDDGGPVTVLCCDNLPDNGRVLRGLVADFVAPRARVRWVGRLDRGQRDLPLHDGRPDHSRHHRATTCARIAAELGARDDGAVVTEPFTQWVIEDDFAAGRPAWERAGAIMTGDVRPYEQIKLRLLNGAHSALAYLAVLADDELVSDAVRPDAPFLALLQRLMAVDVAPTLDGARRL